MFPDKSQLRKEFLSKRAAIAPSIIAKASKKIVEEIISSKEFNNAKIVSCYHPFRNEVDLLSLLTIPRASSPWCHEHSSKNRQILSAENSAKSDNLATYKAIAFPRIVKRSEKLDFYLAKDPDDFEKGVFGLMEPKLSLPKVEIDEIDLFLVPGVAFTRSGGRLGYGGGYYDETLKYKKPVSLAFGICFDIQLTESIPSEEWDIKMDFIITEYAINPATNF